MLNFYTTKSNTSSIPIKPITTASFKEWLAQQPANIKHWVTANNFKAKSGEHCLLPQANGEVAAVLLGIEDENDFWACANLPQHLKEGSFFFDVQFADDKKSKNNSCKNKKKSYALECASADNAWTKNIMQRFIIAWGLGNYKFTRYKKSDPEFTSANAAKQQTAQLCIPSYCDYDYIKNVVDATFLARDLINCPAENLSPADLADVAVKMAKQHGAQINQVIGDDLLRQNYNLIHAIGRASNRPPRFVELEWGNMRHPRLALVGKGVCFDSGGLNLKPDQFMEGMQRDMAGAAHALALAQMIMTAKLPVHLHVALPLAENLISSNSIKPGDIITSRQGKTVEILNTDAEGRLLLADALNRVAEKKPQLIIDFASLTGAAVVALGPEIAAMFTNTIDIATAISSATAAEKEYVWSMPLHKLYRDMLNSTVADIKNCTNSRYGGAITAALFLQEFVPNNIPWIHLDLHGSNQKSLPGRPEGGEALGLKGIFAYIRDSFAEKN